MSDRIDYVLYDSSLGYAVFKVTHQVDGVAMQTADYQKAMASLDQFGKTVKATGFTPFRYVVRLSGQGLWRNPSRLPGVPSRN